MGLLANFLCVAPIPDGLPAQDRDARPLSHRSDACYSAFQRCRNAEGRMAFGGMLPQ